jgi:hypothetical protein
MFTLLLGALLVFQSSAPTGVRATVFFTLVSFAQGAALLIAVYFGGQWFRQCAVYALLAAGPTLIAARRARAHGW